MCLSLAPTKMHILIMLFYRWIPSCSTTIHCPQATINPALMHTLHGCGFNPANVTCHLSLAVFCLIPLLAWIPDFPFSSLPSVAHHSLLLDLIFKRSAQNNGWLRVKDLSLNPNLVGDVTFWTRFSVGVYMYTARSRMMSDTVLIF